MKIKAIIAGGLTVLMILVGAGTVAVLSPAKTEATAVVDASRPDCPGQIRCPLSGELVCRDRCPANGQQVPTGATVPECCPVTAEIK